MAYPALAYNTTFDRSTGNLPHQAVPMSRRRSQRNQKRKPLRNRCASWSSIRAESNAEFFFSPIFPRREYYFCSCTVVHRSTGLNLRIFRNAMPSSRRNVVSFCILFLAYSLLAEPRACPSCLVVIFPPYCN